MVHGQRGGDEEVCGCGGGGGLADGKYGRGSVVELSDEWGRVSDGLLS